MRILFLATFARAQQQKWQDQVVERRQQAEDRMLKVALEPYDDTLAHARTRTHTHTHANTHSHRYTHTRMSRRTKRRNSTSIPTHFTTRRDSSSSKPSSKN